MTQPAPDTEPRIAGVIAPPPLIYAGILALALIADWLLGGPGFGMGAGLRRWIGGVLVLLGLLLPVSAVTRFRSAGTEVVPWRPSTVLVTEGIYQITRNPMYLGMALIYAGISLLADSVVALACLVPVLVVMTYGVIQREERYLEGLFGEDYRAYRAKVRRWL